jgi:hypothetical protein
MMSSFPAPQRPADQVQVLAALGDQRAIVMLPAAIAFGQQKEIT